MRTFVEITWDTPEDQNWLCPDNIKTALSTHCVNTHFEVKDIGKKLKDLDDVTRTQSQPGNYNVDEYMRGMANGLIVANKIVNDSEQPFFEPPPKDEAMAI